MSGAGTSYFQIQNDEFRGSHDERHAVLQRGSEETLEREFAEETKQGE